MYVNSSFSAKIIMASSNDLELIAISVSCRYCIGVFYRPPSSAIDIFDRLSSALSSLDSFHFSRFVLSGVNYFLRTGCFPTLWKTSQVVPIPKSEDRTSPSNYRPISS